MSARNTAIPAASAMMDVGAMRPLWLIDLWWLSIRRQWRQHGGGLLLAAFMALLLASSIRKAPAGGEAYYFWLVLLLASSTIVVSPILLHMESVMLSRRLEILPLSPLVRWLGRLLLANTFRSSVAIITLIWGGFVLAMHGPDGPTLLVRSLQLLGIVLACLTSSVLIEDVIRHSRAAVLHQLLFLLLITSWPVAIEYLRTPSNFSPPPQWTAAPVAAAFLFTTDGPALWLLIGMTTPLVLTAVLVRADLELVARYQTRPAAPPSSVGWTAAVARLLTGRLGEASPLGKELLVPLRFLFLRTTLVILVLTAVAGFLLGAPYLLLSAAFWWQPLSTNALGPDYENGLLRYHLLGLPVAVILCWRLIASIALTAVAIAIPGVLVLITGLLAPPTIGPDHPAMYLVAMGFSLTLLPLWAISGDRYSVRYPDPLEMHTLLPERRRSGGAAAVLTLFFMWICTIVATAVFITAAAALVILVWPGPFDTPRAAVVALLAGAANVAAYLVHARRFVSRGY